MKKFSFRLDRLLELKKLEEENIKLQLAEKNREIFEARKKITKIFEELKVLETEEKKKRSNINTPLLLRAGVAYRYKLKDELIKTAYAIENLNSEAEKIKKKLTKAIKARRSLETIKNNRFTEWKKSYLKAEQNFIDDIAQHKK
ncbi:MAG: flagellar export protein FliJ [Chitinispirillaceae bacterium]|nr:flagellar export protein FliJ [Chitinispirillaceae bacterium]